jgi:predicted component of type VI protein secretion system
LLWDGFFAIMRVLERIRVIDYEGKPMNANLVLLNKNGAHRTFALPNPVIVLGRRHDCDLRIPLPTVSRKHCQLTFNKDSAKLRDLGSRGGTFLNDKQIEPEMDVPVKAGDCIRIGPLTFLCQIDGQPAKIAPPKKAGAKPPQAKPKSPKPPAPDDDLDFELDELDDKLDDKLDADLDGDLSDLDVSDSFINLDELDGDLEDLKDA